MISKTILLHAEQGLGDTIQFIRYGALVKKHGGTVLFECPVELVRLIERCPGIDQVLPQGQSLPPFDVQASLLSLPRILKTTLETVPASVPYIYADPVLTERWHREVFAVACDSPLNVGIVWQGNPSLSRPERRTADQKRSIPLSYFEPLAHVKGVRLFSLQKGFGSEQLGQWQKASALSSIWAIG